jgi:hypothetical protein
MITSMKRRERAPEYALAARKDERMGKSRMRSLRAIVLCAVSGLPAGCSSVVMVSGVPAPPAAATGVTVYAKGATGDAAPVLVIEGPSTGMQFPSAIAIDAHGNRYVANRAANSVTVYGGSARGDAAPIRTIVGAHTGINRPTGLALDARGNIYVVNRSRNTVTVYAPKATGNAMPIRTIEGAMTHLNEPTSIAIDAAQRTYVTNLVDRSVTSFAPGASGNIAPVRIIRGKRTKLTAAFAIAVDRAGSVYVVNSDDKGVEGILVFGARANGNAAPSRVIAGSATMLETASGVAVDARGTIFVSDHGGNSDAGAIRVFARGADGNAAPISSIAGSGTRLRPYGLTIDRSGEIDAVNQSG